MKEWHSGGVRNDRKQEDDGEQISHGKSSESQV